MNVGIYKAQKKKEGNVVTGKRHVQNERRSAYIQMPLGRTSDVLAVGEWKGNDNL